MLNIIDTPSVSAPPLRSAPQQAATPAPQQQQASVAPLPDFTVSSIRVDNHLDLAILEFKSAETGDVVRQYPTEKQIAGYERAAQLETNKEQRIELSSSADVTSNQAQQSQDISRNGSGNVVVSMSALQSAVDTSGGDTANVTQGMAQLSNTASAGGTTQSYTA